MPQHLPEQLSDHVSVVRGDEHLELPHSVNVGFEAEFSDACSVSIRTRVPLESPGVVAADVSPFSSNNAAVSQSLKLLLRMVRELDSGNRALSEMRILETPTFGPARKEKLAELLATVRGFTPSVALDDIFEQEAYALTVRNLVVQTQALAAPILPVVTRDRLTAIDVGNLDLASASLAKAELDALVPFI